MADRYAKLGFDVLVGTDHHHDIDVDGEVDAETVGDYSDLEFPGPILNGVELSADHHVNVIKSENEMVKQINHPMRYDDTADDINQLAEQIGADLVEVTEHGEELAAYPTVADAVQDVNPMPTMGSDAHSTDRIGIGYVVVEVEEGVAVVAVLPEHISAGGEEDVGQEAGGQDIREEVGPSPGVPVLGAPVVDEVDVLTGYNFIRALKDGLYSLGGTAW